MNKKKRWIEQLLNSSLDEMKIRKVPGMEKIHSHGGLASLDDHIDMLSREFANEPEILLYHALLVVLIRREIELYDNVNRYLYLWESERDLLISKLDSRWLVSACDTFIDHNPDPTEKALALSAALFTNTLKIYETERCATERSGSSTSFCEVSGRVELFDGMTAFMIGEGDMIRNLHRRVDKLTESRSTCAAILKELVRRASVFNTVFHRLKVAHTNSSTMW